MTVRRIYAKRAHIDAFRRDMYDNGTILKQAIYHSAVIAHAFGIHVFFDDIKSCKIKPGAANAVIAKRQRYSQLIFVDLTARADSFKASEREKSFRKILLQFDPIVRQHIADTVISVIGAHFSAEPPHKHFVKTVLTVYSSVDPLKRTEQIAVHKTFRMPRTDEFKNNALHVPARIYLIMIEA